MNKKDSLKVSEQFYSIQGEGKTTGRPALFMRLTGCNLLCCFCDTIEVWQKGNRMSFEEIWGLWIENFWTRPLMNGASLVITGGEPMLQAKPLARFLYWLKERVSEHCSPMPYLQIEIETNGCYIPELELDLHVVQYNVSPKLSNSNEPEDKRIVPEAMFWFANNHKATFKFVVSKKNDLAEIRRWVDTFGIDWRKVWLMPEGQTEEQIGQKAQFVADACKEHECNYSSRLQVHIWGETTGV